MVRLSDLADWDRRHILNADVPSFEGRPWAAAAAATERRVAIVTTAGRPGLKERVVAYRDKVKARKAAAKP